MYESRDPRDYSRSDLQELSKIYSPEFNNPRFHDRVLVFDIVRDEWGQSATTIFNRTSEVYPRPESELNESPPSSRDTLKQIECPPSVSRHSTKQVRMEDVSFKMENSAANAMRRGPIAHRFETDNETEVQYTGDDISNADNHGKSAVAENASEVILVEQNDKTVTPSSRAANTDGLKLLKQYRIFVHATWLAVQSTYFQSLFFSGMKESTAKEVHLKIIESETNAHLQLLKAMYDSDILNEVNVDELLAVLELADKYGVKFVFRKCKYVLQTMASSLENCEKMMHVIKVKQNMVDVEDLASVVQTFLAEEFSPLDSSWFTENFRNLSMVSLRSLLGSNEIKTQSENTVFHALMNWIESNSDFTYCESPESPLLSLVRFEMMTLDYLYNVVQKHPIASNMECFKELYCKGITYHALTPEMRRGLDVKPVERKKTYGYYGRDIVQYTWVIAKATFETAQDADELTSNVFWCCGYKMQLSLKRKNTKMPKSGSYCTDITLHALDLSKTSDLRMQWKWEGQNMEHFYSYHKPHNYRFSESNPKYSVEKIVQNIDKESISIDFIVCSLY